MHHVYFFARILPYWAFPLAFVCGQIGLHFRRRHNRLQWSFWGLMGMLILGGLAWIVFRGDIHAEEWVRWTFES